MSGLDVYSSLSEVMLYHVVEAADVPDEIAAWEYLTIYNDSATTATSCTSTDCSGSDGDYDWFKIGLFGNDLTDFEESCDESENCSPEDYVEFDGWAVGFYANTYSGIEED